jgi:N-hydroxyarylamine O-acetyltransferase
MSRPLDTAASNSRADCEFVATAPFVLSTIDLGRYFSRIGYQGPCAATLDVLRELHRLHPRSIPYENLDPLIGRRVRLDLPSIAGKLLESHRGGYCFEQNSLFAYALVQLGFRVTPLLARVLRGQEAGTSPPRTHMVLRVDIDDEPWSADVGFGPVPLTAPLRLAADVSQQTPLGEFRLADASRDAFDLEVRWRDTWAKIYRLDHRPVEWIDYETSNWYTSAAPESLFVRNLIVCRTLSEVCLALFNRQLTERAPDGQVIRERQLCSADELSVCLREQFGLDVGDIDVANLFERVKAAALGA